MILRKPYAFIIRHFRAIHLLLLLPFLYYTFYLWDLYKFFAQLQKSSTYMYAGSINYVDPSIIPIMLYALFFTVVMYTTFKQKKKPNSFYLAMFIYYIALFIVSRITNNILDKMMEVSVTSEWVMVCKEINLLCFIPTLFFDLECFLRGIGFNIKKFNFNKDIADMNIADEDSAEFEVLIGQNNYKYFRFLRRSKREIGYYIKENKLALSIVGSIIVVILGIVGFYYYNAYLKEIANDETSIVDNIGYTINDCYMTAEDHNGVVLDEDYKFVIVDLTLYNASSKPKEVNVEKISLADGDLEYYPTFIYNGKFYDLGQPYERGRKIAAGESIDATLTFQIPKTVTTTKFTFRVQYDFSFSGINVRSEYKKFDAKVRKLDKDLIGYNIELNEYFNTDVAGRNEFSLDIKNYKIKDTFDYNFVKCVSIDKCVINSDVINSNNLQNETLVIFEYDGIIGSDNNFVKTFDNYSKIFANYGYIEYDVYGVFYKEKIVPATNSNVPGYVFASIDRRIKKATTINLVFYFRDSKYIYTLKNT